MNRGSLGEFLDALSYFLKHFSRRTIAVFMAALVMAGLELISASMLLPLLTLGVDQSVNNPLIGYVKEVFSSIDFSYGFYDVFIVLIVTMALKVVAELFVGLFIDNTSVLIARNFREKIIDGLRKVSWGYFTEKPHGLIVNLMTQEIDRATSIFNRLHEVAISTLMLIVYVVVGLAVSWHLLLFAALMGVIAVLVARPMLNMARRAGAGQIENLRDLATDLSQGMQAFKAFKAMAREKELLATLASANDALVSANLLKVKAQRLLTASQQLIFLIAVVLGVYVAHGVLGVSLVEIGFMAVVLMRMNGHLAVLLKKFQAIANTHYALVKFDEFINNIAAHAEVRKGLSDPILPAVLTFENVSFSYGNRSILSDVSLTIPKKGLTTIIGPSGSGKTTIVDLICGFYCPDEGKIIIGDQDFNTLNVFKWRQMIGYVTQEPNLLQKSIAQNVAAFDDDIKQSEIVSAVKAAGAWPFIKLLKDGMKTNVGVSGLQLSGGERQRISIARALAKKPKLLILDEPTAAVDVDTEAELIKIIKTISKKIPVIVISHQSAIATAADVLYRIEKGQMRCISDRSTAVARG